MGEGIVDAAAVNVQILTKMLHGDAAALNVPPRIANTPGRVPFQCLIFEFGFGEPKNKVVAVALVGVFFDAFTHTHIQIVRIEVIEDIIAVQL